MNTFCVLFGRSMATFFKNTAVTDRRKILKHQLILTDEHGYKAVLDADIPPWMRLILLSKVALYQAAYSCSHSGRGKLWEHGPQHKQPSGPRVTFGKGKTAAFRFDDNYADGFVCDRLEQLDEYLCAALLSDDWSYDWKHRYDDCDQGDRGLLQIWNGEHLRGPEWNRRRMRYMELAVTAECVKHGKLHIINGRQRSSTDTTVWWEGYGPAPDARFWNSPKLLDDLGQVGDLATIRCLDRHRKIVPDMKGGVMELIEHAQRLDMLIGLSYLEYPSDDRGSCHSHWEPHGEWPL